MAELWLEEVILASLQKIRAHILPNYLAKVVIKILFQSIHQ